jgi:hypothetical protein
MKASMNPLMEKQHDGEASATLYRATTAENAKISGTTRLFVPNDDLIERFVRQEVNTRTFLYFASENDGSTYIDIRFFMGWNIYYFQRLPLLVVVGPCDVRCETCLSRTTAKM